jgi:TM2 domain-containing membrane protein YozV
MTKKKGSFLTFCFSLLPGAGQMYMGFMKRGISLMSFFFLLIFLASWFRLESIMLIMPIIFFYAFFDTHNIRAMSDEEFYALEDDYILYPELVKEKVRILQGKYRTVFAGALIVIGISILWNNMFDMFRNILPDIMIRILRDLGYYVPQLFVGTAIIALGVYLIRGKKKDLDNQEKLQMLEDKGGNK